MKNIVKKVLSAALAASMALSLSACSGGNNAAGSASASGSAGSASQAEGGKEYKVGIVKFMDHASLDQIESSVQQELDAKSAELGVTFNYADYTFNGQGDSTTLNQIAAQLVDDGVDVVVPIATPAAQVMQSVVTEKDIPIVFAAVTAKLVSSMDAPGGTITGVSDALNTNMIFDMMLAVNPDTQKVGLLYSKSEDSSRTPIEEAKAYLDAHNIAYVEKTGTNTDEVSSAVDSLIGEKVDAIFTPTDNTVMSAELAIFEKLNGAKIPHYTGADSFALNGAFFGYGVNYTQLGTKVADMVADLLVNGADPAATPVAILANETATVNTETCQAIGLNLDDVKAALATLNIGVEEITTAKSFS